MSPLLVGRLEALASLRSLIHTSPLRLPVRLRFERDLINRSVHSSTWIEGNLLSLEEVEALADKKRVWADERQKKEVVNALNALRWVLSNRKKHFTEKKLLSLHARLTHGLLSGEKSGHYRTVQNYVVNAKRVIVFTPPLPGSVHRRMKNLFLWLKTPDLHPVIRSAIFHHEFVTIHPFTDGNGRAARAAAEWLLLQKGLDPLYTLGLDDYFAADRARYYEKIQQVRDLDYDYTHWIEYVTEGLTDSADRILRRIQNLSRGLTKSEKSMALTPKQDELLTLLAHGPLGSAQIGMRMKIGRARVHQLIQPMVKAGILIKEGSTRAARYFLKKA